jgi:hypothetical protein
VIPALFAAKASVKPHIPPPAMIIFIFSVNLERLNIQIFIGFDFTKT